MKFFKVYVEKVNGVSARFKACVLDSSARFRAWALESNARFRVWALGNSASLELGLWEIVPGLEPGL